MHDIDWQGRAANDNRALLGLRHKNRRAVAEARVAGSQSSRRPALWRERGDLALLVVVLFWFLAFIALLFALG